MALGLLCQKPPVTKGPLFHNSLKLTSVQYSWLHTKMKHHKRSPHILLR